MTLAANEHLSHVAIISGGTAFALAFPRSHKDLIKIMSEHGRKVDDDTERGYLTSLGRYVIKES